MNTYEIEKTVERDKCLSRYFLGVFASDMLPQISEKPACFIANTDPSGAPGEHWVAMFFDKNVEYFDSYGLQPIDAFNIYKPNWINQYCLQELDSTVCGEYCIYFLQYRVRGFAPDVIIDKLLKRNDSDKIVKLHTDRLRVSQLYKNCQSCTPRQ